MSTMSIFEQFWAGVPLFFPTKRFYKESLQRGNMEFISIYEKWGEPQLESEIDEWLDRADFYALPFLYYYDSFNDLLEKLDNFIDFHKEDRAKWTQKAIPAIMEQWKGVFVNFLKVEKNQRIEVIMRMCPDSKTPINGGGRPPWFTKEGCFDQLYKTKDNDTYFTILFDGDVEGHWIKKYPVNVVPIQCGSGDASYIYQMNYILNVVNHEEDPIIYCLEDDYVHRDGWTTILREGFSKTLLTQSLKLDYVTLYDHRDKYTYDIMYRNLQSRIGISETVHWRTVPSTTNTWATRSQTFIEDCCVHISYKNQDNEKFLFLGRQGRTIGSCIPGYSTHAHPEHLSPCVKWEDFCKQTIERKKDLPSFEEIFLKAKQDPESCDITEHLDFLYEISKECESILECGVRKVFSSWAFAKGLFENNKSIKKLHCCDIIKSESVNYLESVCRDYRYNFTFFEMSDLEIPMEEYDMIFIDTWHVYGQLKRELAKFHNYAKKYIVMHDTEVDKIYGESLRITSSDIPKQSIESGIPLDEITKGLGPAITEFLEEHKDWKIHTHFTHNNGLTVLSRIQ
jgi:hypothetical protein